MNLDDATILRLKRDCEAILPICDEVVRLRVERMIGSAVLIEHNGKIVLGRRTQEDNKGRWILPGGKIIQGETYQEAAIREAFEETGLHIRIERLAGRGIYYHSGNKMVVFTRAKLIGGELRGGSDLETPRFVSRDELAKLDITEICQEVLNDEFTLEAENAKLQKYRKHAVVDPEFKAAIESMKLDALRVFYIEAVEDHNSLLAENDALEAENTKLRTRIAVLEEGLKQIAGIESGAGIHRACCARGKRMAENTLAILDDSQAIQR